VQSSTGNVFQSGSLFLTGSVSQGYKSQATGLASFAEGLFAKADRFGQYSQASSGFASIYTGNGSTTLGKAQYARVVWCGSALSGDSELAFKGYDSSGNLTPYLTLENGKTYYVKATAALVDTGDVTDSGAYVKEALFYKSGGTSTRVAHNATLSMGSLACTIDIVPAGVMGSTDLSVVIDSTGPSFATVGDLKGTVEIELVEISAT
jgi:hypothetical protein